MALIDDDKFLVVALAVGEAEIVFEIFGIVIRDDKLTPQHVADGVQQFLDIAEASATK
jgi:hypothetical protein